MKNGTQFSKLVMVDGNGYETGGQDSAVDSVSHLSADSSSQDTSSGIRTTLFVLMTVSIACTAAAIAAGSYAIWLSRHQAAKTTLTDVNDILKICQTRMRQLESEVQNLPSRVS